MAKNIKKYVKYLAYTAGILITLLIILVSLINVPAIQTMIVNKFAQHLSEEFKTSISVGRVEFRIFNKVKIEDLLIKDMNNDTLMFVGTTNVNIRKIEQEKGIFSFGKISLSDPYVAILTDSTGSTNLNWYLDLLKERKDSTKVKKQSYISINQIDINNGRFRKINLTEDTATRSYINYNNIDVFNIDGVLNRIDICDTLKTGSLNNLSLQESSGFILKDAHIDLEMRKNSLEITSTSFETNSSTIDIPLISALSDNEKLFDNFINDASLKVTINNSKITLSDLSHFVMQLPNINSPMRLNGKFHGTVAELRGRDINFSFGQQTYLDLDIDISGLPKINDSYLYLSIDKLTTNATDIDRITSRLPKEITLPEIVYNLGTISIDGKYTGFFTDFVTYGNIKSQFGNLNTDISVIPDTTNILAISGLVRADTFNIGYLTKNEDLLGIVSFNADIDGQINTHRGVFSGKLDGIIDSIDINNYRYRDVKIDGRYSEKTWDGHININEKNINADLSGFLSINKKLPEFNFKLNVDKANLFPLNLSGQDSTSQLQLAITSNFTGNSIYTLDGAIEVNDLKYIRYDKNLALESIDLRSSQSDSLQTISLRSDIIDGDLSGHYDSEISSIIKNTLIALVPSKFDGQPTEVKSNNNNFKFKLHLKDTDSLNYFLNSGISLSRDSYITGVLIQDSIIEIKGTADYLDIKNVYVDNFSFSSMVKDTILDMDIIGEKIILPWNSEIDNFMIDMDTRPDTFDLNIHWDNKTDLKNRGEIYATGFVSKSANASKPMLSVDISSSEIFSNNEQWIIGQSLFKLDSTSIAVNHFDLRNGDRFYHLDGVISEDPNDTINMSINKINLKPLNNLLGNKDSKKKNPIIFDIDGTLNGDMYVTNLYHSPLVECAIGIEDFNIFGSELGDMSVKSQWTNEDTRLDINVRSKLNSHTILTVDGFYNPNGSNIYLDLVPTHMPLEALNQFVQSFASDIYGTASGRLTLSGPFNKLVLKGAVRAEDMNMKIDILQTNYLVNDSVYFEKNAILFKDTHFTDERGNNGYLSGSATHDYFKDIRADVLVNVNQTQVFNTKAKDNKNFYGTVYATGFATLKTDGPNTTVDVSARTNKNTRVYIPLNNTGKSISEYSYITFIDKDTIKEDIEPVIQPIQKSSTSLSVDLTATPDAEIQLIFDPTVGDILKLHGSGDLNLELTPKNEVKINGE